ncbi:MAG: hypothetical protein QOG62_1337 [Thermoleophilaceae bacterium]|jgi:hypothetical protein|nr:hypothetical protein [Thermoleophilaceae bacterium]
MRRLIKRLALPTVVLVALAAGALVQGAAAGDTANDFVHHLARVTQKSSLDSSRTKSVTAECPSGLQLISGGADVDGPKRTVGIQGSEAGSGQSWVATAAEVRRTAEPWAVQVFAICGQTDGDPTTGPQGAQGPPGAEGADGRCLCQE